MTEHDRKFTAAKTPDRYLDIIDMNAPELKNHVRMSKENRAAQFSAFDALTGYSDLVSEAARITDDDFTRGESAAAELDRRLAFLEENIRNQPYITVRYFIPDEKKAGGRYEEFSGNVRRIDRTEKYIEFCAPDNTAGRKKIQLERICALEGEFIKELDISSLESFMPIYQTDR